MSLPIEGERGLFSNSSQASASANKAKKPFGLKESHSSPGVMSPRNLLPITAEVSRKGSGSIDSGGCKCADMINVYKRRMLAKTLNDVLRFAKVKYQLESVPFIQENLLHPPVLSDQELYRCVG